MNSVMQEGMQVGDNLSLQGAAEEDDIARAISDSLKVCFQPVLNALWETLFQQEPWNYSPV